MFGVLGTVTAQLKCSSFRRGARLLASEAAGCFYVSRLPTPAAGPLLGGELDIECWKITKTGVVACALCCACGCHTYYHQQLCSLQAMTGRHWKRGRRRHG